jgi:DNA methyltransferase 1-associated protein 1
LVDSRKLIDKLDGELKFAKAQKEEREKNARIERGEALESDYEVKVEEREKSVAPSRGGSAPRSVRAGSVHHKRSASVLSATSEASTKKQKR